MRQRQRPATAKVQSPARLKEEANGKGDKLMASFRFLHAADIHLDSPLKGLSGHEGNAADECARQRGKRLNSLLVWRLRRRSIFPLSRATCMTVTGGTTRPACSFARQMGRHGEAGFPVYLLHGNHDAESQITKRLDLPDNVHVFSTRKAESFKIEHLNVVLHGQSFRQRVVMDNLVLNYPAPVSGAFNIGVLHTGLGGMGGHLNYAPCVLNDLVNKGYDYWALGHIHQGGVLHERPYIVFPGNLQGRHIRETGAKGVYLVTVEDNEVVALTAVPCDVVRWALLRVPLNDADNMGSVTDRIREALESAVADGANGKLLACRIIVEGRSEIHSRLLAAEDYLLAEARAAALGLGDEVAWVEKIVIATEASIDPQTLAQREDAIGELQRMLYGAGNDDELVSQIERDIGEMLRRLPHEVKSDIDDQLLKFAVDGDYAALIRAVWAVSVGASAGP